MILRSPEHTLTPFSWIRALLLSPGILFFSLYLVLYGAISIRMNGAFKELVQRQSPPHTHRITIESVQPAFGLDAITIHKITLIPAPDCPENQRYQITISELSLDMPELQKTIFSNQRLIQSASIACGKIRKSAPDAQ